MLSYTNFERLQPGKRNRKMLFSIRVSYTLTKEFAIKLFDKPVHPRTSYIQRVNEAHGDPQPLIFKHRSPFKVAEVAREQHGVRSVFVNCRQKPDSSRSSYDIPSVEVNETRTCLAFSSKLFHVFSKTVSRMRIESQSFVQSLVYDFRHLFMDRWLCKVGFGLCNGESGICSSTSNKDAVRKPFKRTHDHIERSSPADMEIKH